MARVALVPQWAEEQLEDTRWASSILKSTSRQPTEDKDLVYVTLSQVQPCWASLAQRLGPLAGIWSQKVLALDPSLLSASDAMKGSHLLGVFSGWHV